VGKSVEVWADLLEAFGLESLVDGRQGSWRASLSRDVDIAGHTDG
jgi:hypothetical protein